MMPPARLLQNQRVIPGTQLHAADLDLNDVGPWEASVTGVRDALLDRRWIEIGPSDLEFSMTADRDLFDRAREEAAEAVIAGRYIDAGFIPNEVIISESVRSGKLYVQGYVGMPFSSDTWVLYHTWDAEGCDGPSSAAYVVLPMEEPSFAIIELQPLSLRDRVRALAVGDAAQFTPGDPSATKTTFLADVRVSSLRLMLERGLGGMGAATGQASANNLLDPVMCVIGMLATDGINVERLEPPAKLNRARVKSGKQPFPSRLVVASGPYVTAILGRRHGKAGDTPKGHHASPVCHLRRGHPRRYADGKTIWIRDTLVNARDGSTVIRRSHYAMKGEAQP
jgi:hypothetical protein